MSGILGFASSLAYLGYATSTAGTALAHSPCCRCLGGGLAITYRRATRVVPGWVRSDEWHRATRLLRIGRAGLLATGAGIALAGSVILYLGSTEVFVPEDLAFMGVTREMLDAVNVRLVPLIAHDRAGFGGGLLTTGVLLVCGWFAPPSRAFHQAVVLAGSAGFGCAIGTHFIEGYVNPVHLAPAFAGAGLFAASAACEIAGWRSMRRPIVADRAAALP